MLTFCLVSCIGSKKGVTNRPPASEATVDSLYQNITTINKISDDKKTILEVLRHLRASPRDIEHISELDEMEMHYLVFPLRVVEVVQPNRPIVCDIDKIEKGLQILNSALKDAWVQFSIVKIDTIYADLDINLLKENSFDKYFDFSFEHDLSDTCSLYLFDSAEDLCHNWSCARTQGFANTLATSVNNVVLDKYFLNDYKVIAHEFGHYFGLYHTDETQRFGIEKVDGSNCLTAGDRICDTPADPGSLYSVYVNYSTCSMGGFKEKNSQLEYRPIINNYMSYYPPCYMRPFKFTEGQLDVIFNAAVKVRHNQIIGVAEFPLGF